MKLLCVTPEYPPTFGGGIAAFYGALLPALSTQGISVTVVVGSALADGFPCDANDSVRVIPLDRKLARELAGQFAAFNLTPDFCAHLGAAWAAWQQTEGGAGFDLVECTDWGLPFVPWLVAAGAPPLLVRMHGSMGQIADHDPEAAKSQSEALFRLTEGILLPHAGTLATYGRGNQGYWSAAISKKIGYAPPPLSLTEIPHSVTLPRSTRGLVAARVQPWKGPTTLCRALTRLGNEAPEIDWFGRDMPAPEGGTHGSILTREFPDIWGQKIIPHPPVPSAEIHDHQAKAAFVVVPSTWDVFNLGAVEAMAVGAIVICSRGAGASDLIEDGVNGYLFDAGDDEILAQCLRQAQALTTEERNRMGTAARITVVEKLVIDVTAPLYAEQIREARAGATTACMNGVTSMFTPTKPPPHWPRFDGLDRLPLRELTRNVVRRLRAKVRL